MNLTKTIAQAWQLSFKNRLLWLFGLLAAGLNSEIWEVSSGLFNFIPQAASRANLPLNLPSSLQQAFIGSAFAQDIAGQPQASGLVIALAIVVIIFLTYLRFVSQAALFNSIDQLNRRKKLDFKVQFWLGHQSVLKLLGLSIYLSLWATIPTAVGFLIVSLLAVIGVPQWLLIILATLAVAGWVLYVLALAVIGQFANRAVIIGKVGIISSLPYSLALVKKNLADTFLLWAAANGISLAYYFILAIIGAIGFVASLAAVILFIPLALLPILAFGLVAAIIYGLGSTFVSAIWTLAYLELNRNTK